MYINIKSNSEALRKKNLRLMTSNAEIIYLFNTSKRFYKATRWLDKSIDGQIPLICTKIIKSNELERVSGSELIYEICTLASKNKGKIFFLGGSKEANEKAKQNVSKKYNVEVDSFSPPFENYPFTHETDAIIKKKISQFKPDYLIVCFDAYKSYVWIGENKKFLDQESISFVSGFGGTINILAENLPECPTIIKNIGLESLYRLCLEPSSQRLFRIFKSLIGITYLFRNNKFIN